jgi:hypothetical protein
VNRMRTEKRVHVEVPGLGSFTCAELPDVADEMLRLRKLRDPNTAELEDDGDLTLYPERLPR